MQRRHAAEPLHLRDGKIADPDGADLALLGKRAHGFGGFFDRHQRIGPVDLVDIDMVGLQPPQGVVELLQDARSGWRCGKRLPRSHSSPTLVAMRTRARNLLSARALPTISSERPNP